MLSSESKRVSLVFVALLVACQAEPIDSVEMELESEEEFAPDDLVFDTDPVTVTGVRVGTRSESIETPQRPPGLRADGTFDLALVPEWIPVGIRGEVVGYVRKEDIHGMPSTPEELLRAAEPPIYDEDAQVIGKFADGWPRLDDAEFTDFTSEQVSPLQDQDFSLTTQKHSAAWPLPASIYWYLQNWVPAAGYPGECAQHASGTYGSVFFSNSSGWKSWGGNCNSTNTRPPGWLRSRSWSYDVTGWLVSDSGLTSNAGWTHVHQTTIPYSWIQYYWCGRSEYYMSTASVFTSTQFCAS